MNNTLREFTENTISLAKSKAEEDITLTQGLVVLIAAASFIIGLIVGILCASGSKAAKKKRKIKKSSFDADEYARQLNFDDFDDFDSGDDGSYEYAL